MLYLYLLPATRYLLLSVANTDTNILLPILVAYVILILRTNTKILILILILIAMRLSWLLSRQISITAIFRSDLLLRNYHMND